MKKEILTGTKAIGIAIAIAAIASLRDTQTPLTSTNALMFCGVPLLFFYITGRIMIGANMGK
jgi:hypothetical protein